MSKHKPTTVWMTRLDSKKPYQTVRTRMDGEIAIAFFPGNRGDGFGVTIRRRDARMLARRINQCLDDTK